MAAPAPRRRLLASLLLCVLPVSSAVHSAGPAVTDPVSQVACYTNETACESAAAGCGSGPSAQCVHRSQPQSTARLAFVFSRRPCVTGLRSYCAYAGSAYTWYCPVGALPAGVSYSVDLVAGTPCHDSALSCGALPSNSCAAAECLNGALSACAFTTSVR